MKLVIKNKPHNDTTRPVKFGTALSIAMGVALIVVGYTDNETAILVSSGMTGIITFFAV